MKKLLLIGDSIRMNYDKYVRQALEGKVNVLSPNENACFAAYTYYAIGDWEHNYRGYQGEYVPHKEGKAGKK